MGCSNIPVLVFIETNLGTHLAVPVVSPDIVTKEFKREVERMHVNCFPDFGSISATSLMVKKNSCCYHLSDSLPLKYAFLGSNGSWFLFVEVDTLVVADQIEPFKHARMETENPNSAAAVAVVTGSVISRDAVISSHEKRMKCKRKKIRMEKLSGVNAAQLTCSTMSKKKRKISKCTIGCLNERTTQGPFVDKEGVFQFSPSSEIKLSEKWNTTDTAEAPRETFSESVSVSGIIQKYFSDYDEVASISFTATPVCIQHGGQYNSRFASSILTIESGRISPHVSQQISWEMQLKKPISGGGRKNHLKPGGRLLLASANLGLSPSPQWPALALFHSKKKRSLIPDSSANSPKFRV